MIAKIKAIATTFEDESAEERLAGYDWRELSADKVHPRLGRVRQCS